MSNFAIFDSILFCCSEEFALSSDFSIILSLSMICSISGYDITFDNVILFSFQYIEWKSFLFHSLYGLTMENIVGIVIRLFEAYVHRHAIIWWKKLFISSRTYYFLANLLLKITFPWLSLQHAQFTTTFKQWSVMAFFARRDFSCQEHVVLPVCYLPAHQWIPRKQYL